MSVVDGHPLVAVDRLHLLQEVPLGGVGPLNPQNVVRVLDAGGELLASDDLIAGTDQPGIGGVGDVVPHLHLLRCDLDLAASQVDLAGGPGHHVLLVGRALLRF